MKNYNDTTSVENLGAPAGEVLDKTSSDETEANFHTVYSSQKNDSKSHRRSHHKKHSGRHTLKRRRRGSRRLTSKSRSILINVISCTISAVLLIAMAVNMDVKKRDMADNQPAKEITNSTVRVETAIYTKEVPLVTEAVISYMDSAKPENAVVVSKAFGAKKNALNYGLAWDFTYQVTGLPVGVELNSAELELSEDKFYKNAQVFELDITDYKFSVYNLKPDTKYYYRLNLTLSDDTYFGTVGEFKTAKSPRILNIKGAVNVRDIGGYETLDGKKIKYGLLYRGSEIDGKVEKSYCLTKKGKYQMLNDLKIRFDMDLRHSSLGKDGVDALGKKVEHKYYSALDYSDVLAEKSHETIRTIFADLSEKNNYPMYIHCTYGRDRTGTICYLLEALLGMSDEDLYKEYALSAFTDSFIETKKFETFIEEIAQMDGNSTKEKVESWLLSIGVTEEQIKNIRKILLEN